MDSPWARMILASLVVAVVAVLAFKWCYRVELAATRRNRMVARLIEMFLYQDSLRASVRAAGRLSKALGFYLFSLLLPILAAMVPVMLFLLIVEPLLAYSSLPVGNQFLVETRAEKGNADSLNWMEDGGIRLTAPPFKLPGGKRTIWRFEGKESGRFSLSFGGEAEKSSIEVVVGSRTDLPVPRWSRSAILTLLPGLGKIPETGPLLSATVAYPEQSYSLVGLSCGWMTALSLVSFILAIPVAVMFRLRL